MADEAATQLDVSGDVEQHPAVDHPGRVRQEMNRAANQTQGHPLSATPHPSGAASRFGSIGEQGRAAAGKGDQDPLGTAKSALQAPAPGWMMRADKDLSGIFIPPTVYKRLGMTPEYGDNPWLPLPANMLDPVQQWRRTVMVGRAWNVMVNSDLIGGSVHDIMADHSVQGQLKQRFLGLYNDPAGQWIWENLLPQLLVAGADGNPVTGAASLAGQTSQDPAAAAQQAWTALPWSNYYQAADEFVHGRGVDNGLLAGAFWKSLTATLTIAGLIPELKFLGEGRLAISLPWRRYTDDAISAARRLPKDPDVPPPDKLAEVARGVQALTPTVVRAGRGAVRAAAAPAREAPLVDLTAHLNEIRGSLQEVGPSQDRAAELMTRLRLLNIKDQGVEEAAQAFGELRKGDFASHADFAATRQRLWGALLEALSKADASQVKMPSALDFLGASDLSTLPTKTMHQLFKLSYEEAADRAVQEHLQGQAARYQRRAMASLFRGLFGRDFLKHLQAQGIRPTEELAKQLLPHMAPKMTEGQQAFLRAVWNKFMDYDLRRLQPEDIAPRPLHEYLDELSGESRQHAADFVGSTYGILAFIQGGPHFLEDNPIESTVQSLLSRNRAHEAMLGEFFFPQWAALADKGGVDMAQAMRALRDEEAFQALPPEGRLIVDAWRHVQLLLRDRGMATGFRSDFVGRFDPRVPVRQAEEGTQDLLPRLRSGKGPIGTTSKAHRVEAFMRDPEDPQRVALGEKYRTVFDLNEAMQLARQEHVDSLVGQGVDAVEAGVRASRRYPLYHENLAYAAYEYLGGELRALNAHQAVQSLLHAYTPEGTRLAYQANERAAPPAYRSLRTAGRAFQGTLFHPGFADAIDRANAQVDLGRFEAIARLNSEAKGLIMAFPQIHAMNVAGRVLPMILTHPWAALEELTGPAPEGLRGLDKRTQRMYRVMQAMQNGVVPHKQAREFFTNVMSALGNATGDSRMFEVPTGAQAEGASKFIRDRARQVPGLVGRITPAWFQELNSKFWNSVFAFGVLAYHVEQRALAKRFPDMDPARVNMYAAFRANRWAGAIEPENWSQFGYQASRMLMFAPNWLRSFLELQAPVYLRGELGASKDLQRYMWEQEIRSVSAMLAGQQILGNAMNLLLSGHTIYQNQPQNRNRIEIDPSNPYSPGRVAYDAMSLLDPAATAGIDPSTGLNPKNAAPLTWENPFARQEVQLEQAGGLETPISSADQYQPGAAETFAASHASPIVQALAMAANVDIYKTARNGGTTLEHVDPKGWNPDVLLPAMLQLTPIGYSFGGAAQQAIHDSGAPGPQAGQTPAAGTPSWADSWKAWAQGLPLPLGMRDVLASMPDSAVKSLITNILGVQTPYEKAETTKGTRLGDVQDARLQEVLKSHHDIMASKSQALLSGSMSPYQWRQWYQNYAPTYDGQLQAYFQGSPEYVQGQMGLYHAYQNLYNDAELPDHSGIDWGKLEQLQANFRSQHTDAEMASIQAYQAQQEHDYPALRMYREVTENHRAEQRIWARQMGLTDSQLLAIVKGYGDVAGDRRAQGLYLSKHPQMAAYLRLNEQWEISNPYGRMYSLYYHTAAMKKWLAAAGESEQQGAQQLEREFH